MNEEQLVNQIKSSIAQLKHFDKTKLYPSGPQVSIWNNYSELGLKRFVDKTFEVLILLEKRKDLDFCGYNILNNLNNSLTTFISAYSAISGLVDNQITSHHHNPLSYLLSINDQLRSSGLYSEIKIDPKEDFNKISDALKFGNELLANKVAFENTSEIFKEVLGNKDQFVQKLLNEKGELFEKVANEHRTFYYIFYNKKVPFLNWNFSYGHPYGSFWQMILSLCFGLIIMFIVYSFINTIKTGVILSPGVALLRVSALVVPSYFAYFFSRQFQLSKKMYQYYKFKAVALSTMANLYAAYPNHQDKIIDKALAVIFSEFSEKENDLSQKDVMDLITGLVKNRNG